MSTSPEPVRKSAALQVFAVTLISFLALGFDWGIELTLAANGLAVAAAPAAPIVGIVGGLIRHVEVASS